MNMPIIWRPSLVHEWRRSIPRLRATRVAPRARRSAPSPAPFTYRVDRRPHLNLDFLDCSEPLRETLLARRHQRGHKGRPALLGLLEHPQTGSDDLADVVEPPAFDASLRKTFQLRRKIDVGAHDASCIKD